MGVNKLSFSHIPTINAASTDKKITFTQTLHRVVMNALNWIVDCFKQIRIDLAYILSDLKDLKDLENTFLTNNKATINDHLEFLKCAKEHHEKGPKAIYKKFITKRIKAKMIDPNNLDIPGICQYFTNKDITQAVLDVLLTPDTWTDETSVQEKEVYRDNVYDELMKYTMDQPQMRNSIFQALDSITDNKYIEQHAHIALRSSQIQQPTNRNFTVTQDGMLQFEHQYSKKMD